MASIQHRPGRPKPWIVYYRDPDGRQRQAGFAKQAQARQFRAKTESAMDTGTWMDPRHGKITLAEFAATWLASATTDVLSRQAVEQRFRVHIIPALGTVPLAAIRPSTIQQFIAGLQRSGLSPAYITTIVSALSGCLAAAAGDRIISASPCRAKSVKRPASTTGRVQAWAGEQVAAVRAGLPAHYRALVDVGAGLGLRQGEAFGLAVEDIDWLHRVVHVHRQVRIVGSHLVFSLPKGNKQRDVPLPDAVSLRLAEHIQVDGTNMVELAWTQPGGRPQSHELIFTTPAGSAVNRNTFNTRWREALDSAGIARERTNGFHRLRHTFASMVLAGGCDVRSLADWLGHADPAVTLRVYAHMMPAAPERMRQAIDAALQDHVGGRLAQRRPGS